MKPGQLLEKVVETCGHRRSIRRSVLHFVARDIESEEVLIAASPAKAAGRKGLLAITRRRIAFYHCAYFGSVNVTQYPVGSVTCVSYELHFMSGTLRLRAGQDQFCMEGLTRRATARLAASVHKARMAAVKAPEMADNAHAIKVDGVDSIGRLHTLYLDGVLTRAEFDLLKARLFERQNLSVRPAA